MYVYPAPSLLRFAQILVCSDPSLRATKPYKDAQNILLWRDKICLAHAQLIMSWEASVVLLWFDAQGSGCDAGSMSHAVDVYAFGVVLWEMYTAQRPWAGMRQAQIVHTVCSLGQQLEFPYGTPDRFEVSHLSPPAGLPVSVPGHWRSCLCRCSIACHDEMML